MYCLEEENLLHDSEKVESGRQDEKNGRRRLSNNGAQEQ